MFIPRLTKCITLIIFVVMLGSFITTHPVQASQPIIAVGDPQTPISVQLTLEQLPKIGDQTAATVTVMSREVDAPNTTARLIVPANMQLVGGADHWQGDLKADQPVSFTAEIKTLARGNAQLKATARREIDPTNIWADQAIVYFNADRVQSRQEWMYGDEPATAVSEDTAQAPDSGVSLSPQALHAPLSIDSSQLQPDNAGAPADFVPAAQKPNAPAGTLTITGKWHYINRAGGTSYVKLLTELLDASNNHLAWAWSDWDGSFSFSVSNPGQFKVRAYTYYRHTSMSIGAIRVIPNGNDSGDNFSIGETYYVTTGAFGPYADGTINVGSWRPSDSYDGRFAWWIYDDMLQAFFHPYNCQPECTTNGSWMPDGTTAEWTPTSTIGTYYSFGDNNVHLEGADKDSQSTIVHEYGHAIMWNVYGGAFPVSGCPSPHYIQYVSALNCAWTEGWANLFSMAVRNEGWYQWPSGATLNLETPSWTSANWDDGHTVEGRVAGALWDMIDTNNDGLDTWNAPNGFSEIWDVFYNQNDDNYPEFWSAWVARGHSRHYGLIASYQNTIDYDTAPTISGIPNITRTGAGPFINVVDLWLYANDAESSDSQLTYTVESVSNPNLSVTINGFDYINVDPINGWWGTATVTVKASDGAKSDTDSFTVTILPHTTFVSLIVK